MRHLCLPPHPPHPGALAGLCCSCRGQWAAGVAVGVRSAGLARPGADPPARPAPDRRGLGEGWPLRRLPDRALPSSSSSAGAHPGGRSGPAGRVRPVLQSLVSRHSFSYVFDAEWRRPPGSSSRLPGGERPPRLHSRTHPPVPSSWCAAWISHPPPALAGTGRGSIAAAARGRHGPRGLPRPRSWPTCSGGAARPVVPGVLGFSCRPSPPHRWPLHRLARAGGCRPRPRLAVLLAAHPGAFALHSVARPALPLLLWERGARRAARRARAVKTVGPDCLPRPPASELRCLATLPWLALGPWERKERAAKRHPSGGPPRYAGRRSSESDFSPWLVLRPGDGYAPWRTSGSAITANRGWRW